MNKGYPKIRIAVLTLFLIELLCSPPEIYGQATQTQSGTLFTGNALYYSAQTKESSSFSGQLAITKSDAYECGGSTLTKTGPISYTVDKPLNYACGAPMSNTWKGKVTVDQATAPAAGNVAAATITGNATYYYSKLCGAAPCGIANPCCTNTPITGNAAKIAISTGYPNSWNVGTAADPTYHGWTVGNKTQTVKLNVYSIKVDIKRPAACINKKEKATFTAVPFPTTGGKFLWSTGDTTQTIKVLIDKAQKLSVTFTIQGVNYKATIDVCSMNSETIAISPANRERIKIGVGEEVKLTYDAGNANWAATGAGKLSAVAGVSITYTAGESKENPVVTATGAGGACCVKFDVIEPTGLTMNRRAGTNLQHQLNRPDCGWQATAFIHPDDVNFYRVEIRERDSRAVTTGSYNVFTGVWHGNYAAPARVSGWLPIVNHTAATGSSIATWDNIYSGDPGAARTGARPPFTVGTMTFPMTWQWRVLAKPTISNFPAFSQDHEIFRPGQCRSDKAGHSEQTMFSDATSTP